MAAASVMALSAVGSAYAEAQLLKAQGEQAKANAAFIKNQAEINARFAEMDAEETLRQGDKAVKEHQARVRQTVGEQRAVLAAQGIDIDVGSAAEIQQEAAEFGALDSTTIRNNAWRQAFGYKQEAVAERFRGRFAELGGQSSASLSRFQASNTLVTGGIRAIGFGVEGANRPSKPSGGS